MKSLWLFRKYFLNEQPADGPVRQVDFAMHLEPVDLDAYTKELASFGFLHTVLTTIEYEGG